MIFCMRKKVINNPFAEFRGSINEIKKNKKTDVPIVEELKKVISALNKEKAKDKRRTKKK